MDIKLEAKYCSLQIVIYNTVFIRKFINNDLGSFSREKPPNFLVIYLYLVCLVILSVYFI